MLALLAAMQPVAMRGNAPWFTPDDYPSSAVQKNEVGYVGFSVLVDPAGKVERCDIIAPSAFKDLNDLSCSLVMRRARFTPAVGSNGEAAYGLFRSLASWLLANDNASMSRLMKSRPSQIDLTLFVKASKLPDPIDLVVSVNALGVIGDCQSKSPSAPTNITQLACEQLRSQWKPISGETLEHQAVPTVQVARIAFQLDAAKIKQP